jgi:hypothetical protein
LRLACRLSRSTIRIWKSSVGGSSRSKERNKGSGINACERPTTPTRAGRLADASVDPTDASYIPTDASVVENARRLVAAHRKSDLNRRRSDSSEPIMSLIRTAQWAGDGARRRIESAGSESVMSRGTLSTTALLRATMEPADSVVAGQLTASGDTEGSWWRRAIGGRSSST